MSQLAVEQTLGRLLTDAAFRRQFFEDPCRASVLSGLKLSAEELEALRRLPRTDLAGLASRLDDRICRLCTSEDPELEGNGNLSAARLRGESCGSRRDTGGSDEAASS